MSLQEPAPATRRSGLHALKRAVSKRGDIDSMHALLQRSVKLGHGKLALLRCLQAERMGVTVQPAVLAYCRDVAERFSAADLERLVARAGRGRAP